MRKQAILLAATAAAALFSSSGMAVTFYTTGYGGFVNDGSISSSFPAPVNWWGCTGTLCSSVSWGTGQTANGPFGGQSGLTINAVPISGPPPLTSRVTQTPLQNAIDSSETPPNPGDLGNLTHWNEPITDPGFGPDAVNIKYYKSIYSDADRTNLVWSGEGDFTLFVTETPNTGGGCCDDEFTYTGTFDSGTFTYQGVTYTVTTAGFYDSEGNLTFTFFSPEGGNNTGYVAEVLTPTPEPGTLALIGAGLLSAVAMRRRSKAA